MRDTTHDGLLKRPSCHVLPLIFVLWFSYCYLIGGDGIIFAFMGGYPTVFVTALSADPLTPIWAQWTMIFACGYIQWLLINYLLLKGYHLLLKGFHLIRRKSANRQAN